MRWRPGHAEELIALPRFPSWILGRGRKGIGKVMGEKGEGKGKGREGRGGRGGK